MRKQLTIFLTVFYTLASATFLVPVTSLYAQETYTSGTVMTTATFRFNNQNWFTEPHPQVASFTIAHDGDATGYTETGVFFSQDTIPNPYGIRVQRFSIQDHYHYIINGEVVYTTAELSQKLAQAYEATIVQSPSA